MFHQKFWRRGDEFLVRITFHFTLSPEKVLVNNIPAVAKSVSGNSLVSLKASLLTKILVPVTYPNVKLVFRIIMHDFLPLEFLPLF